MATKAGMARVLTRDAPAGGRGGPTRGGDHGEKDRSER